MRRILCVLLLLLLSLCALAEEQTLYQGDGQYMLTVTVETICSRKPFGGDEITLLQPGTRLITTNTTMISSGNGELWYQVYLPGQGYGYVNGADVQYDEPQRLAYRPGFGVSAALFTVENPEDVRVEVTSLDGLEYPVVTLHRIYTQQQEDGMWCFFAAFGTASDVCKTTDEVLCATLYGLDGEPIEMLTLSFYAPFWR